MADVKASIELTAIDNTTRVFNQVSAGAKQLERTYDGLKHTFEAFVVGASLEKLVEETLRWEQASFRLNATLRATGNAVGVTRREMDEMAHTLSQATPFDETDLRNAEANLVKFGNIHDDVFKEALKLSADYAAFTGTNVTSATQAIGRALSDPVNGLKALQREFGNLTFTQKEYIASLEAAGRTEEAQIAILDLVRGRIGGVAEELNQGMTRAVNDGKKAWEHWFVAAGQGLAVVAGELDRLGGGWANLVRQMRGQPLGLPPEQMARLGAPAGGAQAAPSWEEQSAQQQARLASMVAKATEAVDRENEARAKAIPIIAQWNRLLRDQTNEERALDFVLKGEGRTLGDIYKAQILNIAVEADWRRIYKERQELSAMYARALRDETLSEEENVATRVKDYQDAWMVGTRKTFQDYVQHAKDGAEQASFFFRNAFSRMEDALVEFSMTGKINFRAFANSVVADLIRIQIRQQLAGFASSGAGSFLGSLGGALGLSGTTPAVPVGFDHAGGIVGNETDFRRVDPRAFIGAPRMHMGGLAGDEVPVILQRGEIVLPRGASGMGPVIHQNIRVGGNVTQADIPRILEAARIGAAAAIAEDRRRNPNGPFGG